MNRSIPISLHLKEYCDSQLSAEKKTRLGDSTLEVAAVVRVEYV